jgi:hypothetical protein
LRALPKALHREPVEQRFVRYQHHVLGGGLVDQLAIERVLLGNVHVPGEPGMMDADR